MRRQQGYSLIELIIFIIILGLIAGTLLVSMNQSLQKSPVISRVATALDLAQQRMDVILGQKQLVGFTSFSDVCLTSAALPFCVSDPDYVISSAVSVGFGINTVDYKVVTVDVSGAASVTLTGLITNYAGD